jgi:hypothetical protein
MDGLFAQTESWEEAVDSVHSSLLFEFRDDLSPEVIAEVARESVDELRREPIRITTFVPLLALRRARDRIRLWYLSSETTRLARP